MSLKAYPLTANRLVLEFESVVERDAFVKSLSGTKGIRAIEYSENTRRVRVELEEGSPLYKILRSAMGQRRSITREDIHFYLSPFIKHPAVKALFSMLMLGGSVGLISFGVCSLFLIPYLKAKL